MHLYWAFIVLHHNNSCENIQFASLNLISDPQEVLHSCISQRMANLYPKIKRKKQEIVTIMV